MTNSQGVTELHQSSWSEKEQKSKWKEGTLMGPRGRRKKGEGRGQEERHRGQEQGAGAMSWGPISTCVLRWDVSGKQANRCPQTNP